MTDLWELPERLTVGTAELAINADFRNILKIFRFFQRQELPEALRWEVALRLFYRDPVPETHRREAMEALSRFLTCGQMGKPGPKLLDWDHDAMVIVSDVNRVAGCEIRQMPFLHWWTFLGWFHAIGEGQLSGLVSIRRKLATGKKLEEHERQFYQDQKTRVDLPKHYTAGELAEQARLRALLDGRDPVT